MRRARLFAAGTVGDWGYKAQFNIAESDGSKGGNAEDLYIQYKGFGPMATITAGKQSQPNGLENSTSSKDISSLERSAITEFYAKGRAAGVSVTGAGSNWTYGIGIYEADGNAKNDIDGQAITARITYAPIATTDLLVHLGASTSYDLGTITNNRVTGFELAAATGAAHFQAEFFDGKDNATANYQGYYAQVGYVVTGESRPYKNGVFKRVKPASKIGAVELVARYENGDGKYSDAGLGAENGNQLTLGANWYVNNYTRLGVNYMKANSDTNKTDGREVRARVQFAF